VLATDDDLEVATRIVLHGVTGSGKTTLARRLATGRGVPFLEGDSVGWLPGWRQRDPDEQRGLVADFVVQDAWVIDSAWSVWADLVLARADLLVVLDLPRHVSFARLLRRTLRRLRTRERVCNGNVETWGKALSRDSIVLWHFRSWESKRSRAREWAADPQAPPVVLLRSAAEVEALARRLVPGG
jgi:adenylate kinase family enzyme